MSSIKKAGAPRDFGDGELEEQKNYNKGSNTSSDSDSESVKNLVIDIGEPNSLKLQCSDACQLADDNKLDKSLKMTIKRKSKCTEKHEIISNDVSKLSDVVQKCKITTANYVDSNIVKNKSKSKANKNIKALKESDKDASDPYNFNNEEQVILPCTKRARLDKNESGSNVIQRLQHHVEINTNSAEMSTTVEPDLLGPCDPGTAINLDGIVWLETATGMLVVNVTWRGRTYVGTLLDATQHEFAPPSPKTYESAMDQAARNQRRRGRRRGGLSTQAVRAMLSNRSNNRRHMPPLTNATNNVSNGGNGCAGSGNGSMGNNGSSTAVNCASTADTDSDSSNHALLIEPPLFGCPQPGCCKRFPDILAMKFHHNETHRRKPAQSPEPTANRLFAETSSEVLLHQHPSSFTDIGGVHLSVNDGTDVVFKLPTSAAAILAPSIKVADTMAPTTASSSDLFSPSVAPSPIVQLPSFGAPTAPVDCSFASLCSRSSPVLRGNVTPAPSSAATVISNSVGSRGVKTVTVEGTFPVPVGSPGVQSTKAPTIINKEKGNKTVSAAIYPIPFMVTSSAVALSSVSNEFISSNCDTDSTNLPSFVTSSSPSSSSNSTLNKCKKTEIKSATFSAASAATAANLGTYSVGSLNLKPIQPKPTMATIIEGSNSNAKSCTQTAPIADVTKDKKTKKRKSDTKSVVTATLPSCKLLSDSQAPHTKRSMSVDEAGSALSYILPSQHHYHGVKCNNTSGKPDSPRRRGDSPRKAENPASPAYSDISDGSPAPVLEKEADLGKVLLPPPTLSLPSTCDDSLLKLPISGGSAANLVSYPFFSHPPNLLPAVQATDSPISTVAAPLSGSSTINTSANVICTTFDTTAAVNGTDASSLAVENLGSTTCTVISATDLSHSSNRGSPNAPNKPSIGSSPTEEKRSQGGGETATPRPRKEKSGKPLAASPSSSHHEERVVVKRERDSLDEKHTLPPLSRSTHSPALTDRFRSQSKRGEQAEHRSNLDCVTQSLLSPTTTPRNMSRAPPGLTNFSPYSSCYPPALGPMLPAGYEFCMPPPPPPPSSMNAWPPLPHFSSVLSPSHFASGSEKSFEALGHYVGLPGSSSSSSHKIHELARCDAKSSSTSVSSSCGVLDGVSGGGGIDVGMVGDTVKSPPTLRHAHTHSHMHMFSGSPLGPGGTAPSSAPHGHLGSLEHFPYSGSILHTHHNSLSSPFLPK